MARRLGSLSWRRLAVIGGAVVLIMLGLAGLVLPVLPGIVFLIAAVALLAREFEWARTMVDNVRSARRHTEDDDTPPEDRTG